MSLDEPAAKPLVGDAAPDIGELKAYSRSKQAIAAEVRTLHRSFTDRAMKEHADACQELLTKLAEDRFTLAVVGQFKRGKSSLMNAIIGRDLLPTGVLPLTSAITVLKYGPEETLTIHRERQLFPEHAQVSQLEYYVTEKGNPGNREGIKRAEVELPLPFLRQGLEFVDTPGIGSSIEANTETTYRFLPECDAVLFVTSAEMPITSVELDFLARLKQFVRKIFFVVNKVDLLEGREADDALRFASKTLEDHSGLPQLRVFAVSSRVGMAAKVAKDPDAYSGSGIKNLEESLAAFLSAEKSATFLLAILDKALRLTGEPERMAPEPADGGSVEAVLSGLHRRVEALCSAPTVAALPRGDNTVAVNLRTRGCPVCSTMGDAAFDFLSQWQYLLASDQKAQEEFAAEVDICPLHAWQLFAVSSPYGISLAYPKLMERVSAALSGFCPDRDGGASVVTALVPQSNRCRVCALLRDVESNAVQQLANQLGTSEAHQAYAGPQGTCLRHLALLIGSGLPADIKRSLVAETARRFDEYAEDMRSFATKHDGLRRALMNRNESDAHFLAMIRLFGEKKVCTPWEQDACL